MRTDWLWLIHEITGKLLLARMAIITWTEPRVPIVQIISVECGKNELMRGEKGAWERERGLRKKDRTQMQA